MIVMFCAVFVLELPGSIEESVQAAVTEHQLETMGAQTTQSQNRTPQAGVPASAKPQSQEKVKAPSATDKRHINTSSASSDWKKKQIDAHGSDTRETKKKTDSSEQ